MKPAAELIHRLLVPALDAEIGRCFRHPAGDIALAKPHVLQTKSQLVPHLIGHDLLIGALHHIAYGESGGAGRQLLQRHPIQQDGALPLSHGGQLPLEQPEQRGFAASGSAADGHQLAFLHRKGDLMHSRGLCAGVGEAHLPELKQCHTIASLMLSNAGRSTSTP